jgi:hypothetical protein
MLEAGPRLCPGRSVILDLGPCCLPLSIMSDLSSFLPSMSGHEAHLNSIADNGRTSTRRGLPGIEMRGFLSQ